MRIHKADGLACIRRDFVRAGIVTASAVALGPGAHRPALAAADAAPDLDDLRRSVRGRLLRGSSTGYDEARRVWNLAYDRRPLAMVRAADVEKMQDDPTNLFRKNQNIRPEPRAAVSAPGEVSPAA